MGYGYGQTEVTGFCLFGGYGGRGEGNAGRPAPVTSVRILDAGGRECAIGEAGEICVRGGTVHLGYWNRPEINAERFRGGWWHTTDLGRREPDGTITFLGTMTRMIKSGAENIFPAEVENCLEAHPAVQGGRRHRRARRAVPAGRQGRRGAQRDRRRSAPRTSSSTAGAISPRTRSRRRSSSSTRCRAPRAVPRTTRRWTRSSAAGAIRVATTSAAAIRGERSRRPAREHRGPRPPTTTPGSAGPASASGVLADAVRRLGQHGGEVPGLFRCQPDQPVTATGVHRDLHRGRPGRLGRVVRQVLRGLHVETVRCGQAARPGDRRPRPSRWRGKKRPPAAMRTSAPRRAVADD